MLELLLKEMSPSRGAQVRDFIDSGSGWDGAGRLMMGVRMKGDPMMDERRLETVMEEKSLKGRAAATASMPAHRLRVLCRDPANLRPGPDKPAKL